MDVDKASLTGSGGAVTLGQVRVDGGNVRGRLAVTLTDLAIGCGGGYRGAQPASSVRMKAMNSSPCEPMRSLP